MTQSQGNKWRTEVDQQLGVVTTEINSIKSTLRDQGQILGKIFSRLDEISGRQGPGIGQVLTIVVAGGAIVSMAAGAVTVLVMSLLAPGMTRLETQGQQHQAVIGHLLEERIGEFRSLKSAASQRIEERLARIEERLSKPDNTAERVTWAAPEVKPR